MSDIFHEVDEEVRRERLKQLWERHSNLIVAVALLIVLGVAGWRGYDWWEVRKAAESGARFEAAVKLAEDGKQTEAQAAFSKIAQDGSSGYRILARFREGAELAKIDRRRRRRSMRRLRRIRASTARCAILRPSARA